MMRDRRYGGNSRLRSPSPSRRRLSPPSVRFRDHGYSPPRKGDGMDTDEGRHGEKYSRRDYNRRYERGDRDYGRSCGRGDRYFERNYERGGRDHERNSDRGDRSYDRSFNYRGPRISNFEGGDRDRYRNGEEDAGAGHPESICRSNIYQSTSDVGSSGRVLKYDEGLLQGDSSSAKSQWDHLSYEPKKSDDFKGSINQGISGSGLRNELDYSYQKNKYFDEGRAGFVLDNKTASMEAERGRDYSSSSYQMDHGVLPKSSSQVDGVGGFTSVSSHFLNTRLLHKDENFHFCDKPHLDKLVADGPFVGDQLATEANPSLYSRTDIDFMASSSRSKAFDAVSHRSFKEDIPGSSIPSDRVKFSSGMTTNYFGFDDYGARSRTRSPVPCGGRLDDFKSFSRSYVDAAEERSSKLSYSEVGRSERSAMVTRSLAGKMEDAGEHYGHQDMLRVGMLDTNNDKLDGSSHQGYLRGNRWEPLPTSLGQSTSNYYDAHVSCAKREDVHDQDFGSHRPLYERDLYHGHGSSIMGELHHDYGVAGISWFPKKGADRLSPREYDSNLGNVDGRLQKELLLDDIRFPRPFKKTTKRRHNTEKQASEHGVMFYDKGCAGESWRDDMDSNVLSKKLRVTNSKNGKNRKISSLMAYQQPSRSSPVSVPTYSGKPHKFGTRDIKKRLGPHPQKAHVSQRLAQKFKPSLKKRLGPGPQKSHFTLPPWVKNRKAHKLQRTEDASDGSHLDQGEEPQEDTVTPAKPEPPENSEEFRQMVFSAFFKFVKQLNETPAKRKKYKEQGKAGSLKCIVCGSSSEEFGDTESLVTHAFTSQKDGVRSQHLGFHKALCALMGWKSAEAVNSVWICETLSHTENLCIKEDLILWPPVVIVHNSTITNQNPDQRVIITLEKLEARLRDMGFGDKMKVLRGKPANQSIMVVQFGGTLSGLLEAERLHKMYFGTKHGRAEFQQVKSHNNGSNSGEAKDALINEANILYGYLGTAEDLDKLDFYMKKRCVVKSKNDIQNIAGAPLKTQ